MRCKHFEFERLAVSGEWGVHAGTTLADKRGFASGREQGRLPKCGDAPDLRSEIRCTCNWGGSLLRFRNAGALLYSDDGADLERRGVCKNVCAVYHAPFIPRRRRAQMILVVINLIAPIPVFVLDRCSFFPFLMFDVRVVIVMILVSVLGKCSRARKACRKDRECQNSVQFSHGNTSVARCALALDVVWVEAGRSSPSEIFRVLNRTLEGAYSACGGSSPAKTIGRVGFRDPEALSTVTPKAFASIPAGICGNTRCASPEASGRKSPAGMGALPFAGMIQSS